MENDNEKEPQLSNRTMLKRNASYSPIPTKIKMRRKRCMKCENCLREDCGICRNCVKKTKFGGDGSCKNACLERTCNFMDGGAGSTTPATTSGTAPKLSSQHPTQQQHILITQAFVKKEESSSPPPPPLLSTSQNNTTNPAVIVPKGEKDDVIQYLYGKPVLKNRGKCAECIGARDSEALRLSEPIILCDGEGCNREFHLGCLGLADIPTHDYVCKHCDPLGTTADLIEYFERCQEKRATFDTSYEYVMSLAQELIHSKENLNEFDKKTKSKKTYEFLENYLPDSEICRARDVHRKAIAPITTTAPEQKSKNSNEDKVNGFDKTNELINDYDEGPGFFVGKPIRLYVHLSDTYHFGRILDWRSASNFVTSDSDRTTPEFYGKGQGSKCEFLIRFLPGLNGRKKILYHWVILEEHSLAVGTSLVWGCIGKFKGMYGWKPGQTLMRTSLELTPIKDDIDIVMKNTNGAFAFTYFFGAEFYALLDLREEAVDFATNFNNPNIEAAIKSSKAGNLDVTYALTMAKVEMEEQHRIKYWHLLTLQNAAHEKALTLADPYSLKELPVPGQKQDIEECKPKFCVLIQQGVSRISIGQAIPNIEHSLDTHDSFTLKPVSSMQQAISQIQKNHKEDCRA